MKARISLDGNSFVYSSVSMCRSAKSGEEKKRGKLARAAAVSSFSSTPSAFSFVVTVVSTTCWKQSSRAAGNLKLVWQAFSQARQKHFHLLSQRVKWRSSDVKLIIYKNLRVAFPIPALSVFSTTPSTIRREGEWKAEGKLIKKDFCRTWIERVESGGGD